MKTLFFLAFAFIGSISFSQSDIIEGGAPEYWNSTTEIQSFYSTKGIEGEMNKNLIDWLTLQYVTVTYQHYLNKCDERKCSTLGYSIAIAHKNSGVPTYQVKNNKIRFLFESKKYEFSKAGRKAYGSGYYNTAYIVKALYNSGKFQTFFFYAPLK